MKTIYLFLIFFAATAISATAQTSLTGKVTDLDTGEELIGANVVVYKDGVYVKGASTDFDGNYLMNLDPGTYDVEFSYIGYPSHKVSQVMVKAGQVNRLNIQFTGPLIELDCVMVTAYKVPLMHKDNSCSAGTITSEQIRNLPTKDISGLASSTAGLSTTDSGADVHVRGSRVAASEYYVDGIRVRQPDGSHPQPLAYSPRQQAWLGGGTPAAFADPDDFPDVFSGIPATDPGLIANDPVSNNEEYIRIKENEFISPINEDFSTFSIDVDQAAYSIVRRDIMAGRQPVPDAARTEEMINYFDYEYPEPNGDDPFEVYTELSECPWNTGHQLLHIGLQGERIDLTDVPGCNLVFLIDVSGSMSAANKLELLKPSFKLLVNQLRDQDRIAIVVYAGAAGLVLPSTLVSEKTKIIAALDQLRAGGSTAGGAGIELAYKTAKENFIAGGNNRVILATDGDFNVGVSSQDDLKTLIETKRNEDIFLTVLGYGFGNLKDNRLETLADAGNGNYAYISDMEEATKVFVHQITGTLYTIAKDVKIQVVFNPRMVQSYRLIGYENRLLATKDFDDDTKDAGELGAGHTVTALYEIIPREAAQKRSLRRSKIIPVQAEDGSIKKAPESRSVVTNELITLKLRYKKPEGDDSKLIETKVLPRAIPIDNASDNFHFSAAVASFSLLLRDSKYKGDSTPQKIIAWAERGMGADENGYRQQFVDLVKAYEVMTMVSAK